MAIPGQMNYAFQKDNMGHLGSFTPPKDPIMVVDRTPGIDGSSKIDETFNGKGLPANLCIEDFMLTPDLGLVVPDPLSTTFVSQVLLPEQLHLLQQQFTGPQLDVFGQHQVLQYLLYYQQQQQLQSSLSLPLIQHQENDRCAQQLQQHPPVERLHDELLSQSLGSTSALQGLEQPPHMLESLQLIAANPHSLQQQYVVQGMSTGLDRWGYRSSSYEPLSSPDEVWSTSDEQGYFNISPAPEDRSFSPVVGLATPEELSLARLDVSEAGANPGRGTATAAGFYLQSPSSTTTSLITLESQQFDSSSDSEAEESVVPVKTKRARRPTKGGVNNQSSIKLKCAYPDCTVTCSSSPSLDRHQQTHKWRGIFARVRCEACQRDLSNEFSVQRHIRRSQPTSRCRRMRVYSMMRSKTEIETTVRFYPKRAHGKKTVAIDLTYARVKYMSTPINK
ncbi:hypothetical protein BGZ65_012442 [Modicella reniformis]|uniref:C2H2-type domain-containing protein n=1 Tax=Modicella reniformis TaxID=1440133 RepID=A0A9P6MAA2_9FUNG|nr:hypothetical protein BGZ65_012442 [Modicella reniformis]